LTLNDLEQILTAERAVSPS